MLLVYLLLGSAPADPAVGHCQHFAIFLAFHIPDVSFLRALEPLEMSRLVVIMILLATGLIAGKGLLGTFLLAERGIENPFTGEDQTR